MQNDKTDVGLIAYFHPVNHSRMNHAATSTTTRNTHLATFIHALPCSGSSGVPVSLFTLFSIQRARQPMRSD